MLVALVRVGKIYSAIYVLVAGVLFTGFSGLHACCTTGCWTAFGRSAAFWVTTACLGYTEVVPCTYLVTLCLVHHVCPAYLGDIKCEHDYGWPWWVVAVVYTPMCLMTTGLSLGGVVGLRACASGRCYPHLSIQAAKNMLIWGQIVNTLLVWSPIWDQVKEMGIRLILTIIGTSCKLVDCFLSNIASGWEFLSCSTKKRRQVLAVPDLPA